MIKGSSMCFCFIFQTGLRDQKDIGSTGILKRASPTLCLGTVRQLPGSSISLDIRNPGKQAELANSFRAAQGQNVPQAQRQPLPSSHIPVIEVPGGCTVTKLFFPLIVCDCDVVDIRKSPKN
ncbi:hypothetical protein GOODEAATRI_023261 [Goodea atripinnis]|uniref:Uncharacterized protein n=1 Tax=Goodea atripinnis TaxID=208336 RepID=A0ABV0MWK9_9TELE